MTLVPVLERLEALDVEGVGAGGIAMALGDVTRLERYLASLKVRLAARASGVAGEGRGAPAAEVLKRACRTSSRDAAAVESAAELTSATPELGAAMATGVVGIEHVNAYGSVERTLSGDQQARLKAALPGLLDNAALQSPEVFRRAVAAEARQIRTDDGEAVAAQQRANRSASFGISNSDGMGWLSARFDPESASRVFAHLTAERDRRLNADRTLTPEHATVDALVDLILGTGRTPIPGAAAGPGVVEVMVMIDLQSLRHGAHLGGVSYLSSGAHIPVSQVRRLCCEARILPMVLDGEGRPLDVGRAKRLATREQRRALRKLHKTCAFPDCHVAFDDCQIHHVQPFDLLGDTDLANLAPVCSRHHHLVHEGGWRMAITPGRTVQIWRPDGTPYATIAWRPPDGEHPEQPPDLLEEEALNARARERCRRLRSIRTTSPPPDPTLV